MKKLLLLILLASSLICKSQNYSYQSIPYQDNTFRINPLILQSDDVFSNAIPIGFDFSYFGYSYSSLVIGGNGVISFNPNLSGSICEWDLRNRTVDQLYNKSIFLTYQDMDITLGGKIFYSLIGSTPFREFIISFDSVALYDSDNATSSCANTTPFSGYLILHETTNTIELYIKHKDYCDNSQVFYPGWNDGLAISGLKDTTNIYLVLPNRGLNTVWSADNEAWRFCPNGSCFPQNIDSFNLIKGNVFLDIYGNCLPQNNRQLENQIIKIDNSHIYTKQDGSYEAFVSTGQHTISILSPTLKNCSGDTMISVYFSSYGDSSIGNNFLDTTINQMCSNLSINVGAWQIRACSNFEYLYINYSNNGFYAEDSVDINLTLNDSMHIISSSAQYTIIGNNQYRFHLTTPLLPHQNKRITLHVKTGCDSVGTTYCYNASIHSFNTICTLDSDTISYECTNLLASFDPNEKLVAYQDYEHKGYTTYEEIDSTNSLLYKICFQNTGNAPAQTVILRDTLANYLDPSSIKFIASSHTYSFDVTGHVLTITYNDINLVDSSVSQSESTGWVRFSINQIAGNTEGTTINNRAGIYFDSNPVVTTNTVTNLIPESNVLELDDLNSPDISVKVYPNPFNNEALLTVIGEKGIKNMHLTIYDMVGRLVTNYEADTNSLIINRKGLSAGIYLYSLRINNALTKTGLLKVF